MVLTIHQSSVTAAGIETLTLDVLSEESLSSCVASLTKLTGGSLDGLVNNAGGGLSMPLTDLSIQEGKRLFDLNVWAPLSTTQAFLPMLMKAQPGALVVNNTSVVGLMPIPFQGAYNASKSAAISMSDNLRLELSPFGIQVIDLRTAAVQTQFFANLKKDDQPRKLPATSIYQVAPQAVENMMNGIMDGKSVQEGAQTADMWAKSVAADLTKKNPPSLIWRGTGASLSWALQCVPHGMLDSKLKTMTGLDKVATALKEQERT